MSENPPTKLQVALEILKNLPSEVGNFHRIPCAMQSLYTGIVGGTLLATACIVSTGKLASARFGLLGYAASSIISWHLCRSEFRKSLQTHTLEPETSK